MRQCELERNFTWRYWAILELTKIYYGIAIRFWAAAYWVRWGAWPVDMMDAHREANKMLDRHKAELKRDKRV